MILALEGSDLILLLASRIIQPQFSSGKGSCTPPTLHFFQVESTFLWENMASCPSGVRLTGAAGSSCHSFLPPFHSLKNSSTSSVHITHDLVATSCLFAVQLTPTDTRPRLQRTWLNKRLIELFSVLASCSS